MSDRRAAIVIGNGGYRSTIGSLDNGPNDAIAMTSTLMSLGFEVTFGIDLSEKAVDDCLEGIRASAQPWDVVVFHYSGHGIQINDENYLVGVDTVELTPKLVGLRPLQPIIDTLQSHATAVLVFLDACRNNPFAAAGQQGLSVATTRNIRSVTGQMDIASAHAAQARGLFVAYATSPNAVASDGRGNLSPFTDALVSGLSTAGWSIQRTLSQVTQKVGEATQWSQTPWSKSSLTSEIKLNGRMTLEETLAVSEAWTRRSVENLDRGLRDEAIAAALSGLPSNLDARNRGYYAPAYLALYDALSTMRVQFPDANRSEGVVFSPDRRYVVRAGDQRPYQVWDVKEKSLLFSLAPTGSSGGGTVDWAPDSATVAIVTGDGLVSVARVPSGQIVTKFNGSVAEDRDFQKYAHVDSLNFDESGRYLVSAGGYVDPIKIFDVASGRLVRAFSQNELRKIVGRVGVRYILSARAKMLRDGTICAGFSSGDYNQNLAVVSLSLFGNKHRSLYFFRERDLTSLDCTQDGSKIAIVSYSNQDSKLTIVNTTGEQKINVLNGPYESSFFNESGSHLAAWKDGAYQYLDLVRHEAVSRPGSPNGYIRKSWGVYSTSGQSVGYPNGARYLDVWSYVPNEKQIIEYALLQIPEKMRGNVLSRKINHPTDVASSKP